MKNDFIKKNENPQNKRIGDCVLRAFTSMTRMDYEDVKKEILKYGSYYYGINFDKFAKEIGLVKISQHRTNLSTQNRVGHLCKNYGIDAIAITNNHACYINKNGATVDTWDSRNKRPRYTYIWKDDAEMIGLDVEDRVVTDDITLVGNDKIKISKKNRG